MKDQLVSEGLQSFNQHFREPQNMDISRKIFAYVSDTFMIPIWVKV